MLYMFLLYGDPDAEWPPDIIDQHLAFWREARDRGAYVSSEALGADTTAAAMVRVREGETLTTDGPFSETKEVVGGYYILDCKSDREAREYAAKIPDAKYGKVVVRPIVHVPNWPYPDAKRRHG
jgi:hypothetical protein